MNIRGRNFRRRKETEKELHRRKELLVLYFKERGIGMEVRKESFSSSFLV